MSPRPVKFSIPDSELPGLRLLARASLEDLAAIHNALQAERPTLDVDALARSVAQRASLDQQATTSILGVLWRLAFVQRHLNLDTNAFLAALSESLRTPLPNQWSDEDAEAWEARRQQVAALLTPEGPISSGAKAAELLLEQQLVFCTARTITDLRPVFDEQAQRLQGFLPCHTLAITCHEGGETRHLYIALDGNDIAALRRQLERAEQKERLIRRSLAEAGFSLIETGDEADA